MIEARKNSDATKGTMKATTMMSASPIRSCRIGKIA